MYNETVKFEFIESLDNDTTKIFATNFFGRTDRLFEQESGKDLAEMGYSEIVENFQKLSQITYTTVRTHLAILRKYLKWYNNNITEVDVTKINNMSTYDVDISLNLFKSLIKDEEELAGILSVLPQKDGYFEIPILLLSWSGITLSNILELKNNDVIFKDTFAFIRTTHKIYRITSAYIVNALKDYKFVKSSTRQHRGLWNVYPDDLGYFIKNMVQENARVIGNRVSATNVRKKIVQFNKLTPGWFKEVTVDKTLLSGKLNRLVETERRLGNVPIEILLTELGGKKALLQDVVALYNSYKKAFSIKL
ncbi:MAG: hypothetical protein WCR36_06375 [Bacteroidaceae bacterium]